MTVDDLSSDARAALLRHVRQRRRRVFTGIDDATALGRLNVLTQQEDDRFVPTLTGLLALGVYPQQFVPQLNVTFVVHPPLSAVIHNMSIRAFIEGAGRRDVYDYPVEALPEAIVNALVHRDHSPYSRGTAVQIVMYADHLVITNPGGLYGTVIEDDLGAEGVSSTRNSTTPH